MTERSFGLELLGSSPADVLDAEQQTGRDAVFAQHEALLWRVLSQACAGERVLTVTYGKQGERDVVEVLDLDAAEEAFVQDHYSLARQEAWRLVSPSRGLAQAGAGQPRLVHEVSVRLRHERCARRGC